MIFGEPERTEGDLNFSLFGIPVRVHPFFWVMGVLLGMNQADPLLLILWIAAVFPAILIHELGHALLMRSFGFYPSIVLCGMGGLASYGSGRPYRAREPGTWGHVAIALAGPGAGFALAGLLYGALRAAGYPLDVWVDQFVLVHVRLAPHEVPWSKHLTQFINDLFFVCIYWGIINLLPIYPLDGGQIAQRILVLADPRGGVRLSLVISMVAAGLVAAVGLIHLGDWWTGLFFVYLAANSYAMLKHES